MNRVYLGDSVYAEFDGYVVTLKLNNGGLDFNDIYLEPEVIDALKKYLDRLRTTGLELQSNER